MKVDQTRQYINVTAKAPVSTRELAVALGVTERVVYTWVDSDPNFPCTRSEQEVVFDVNEVTTYWASKPERFTPTCAIDPKRLQPANNQGSLTTEWLTTEEAAEYLRVSVGSLRNLTSNGKVPYYKWQRRNRYKKDELRELLLRERRGSHGN